MSEVKNNQCHLVTGSLRTACCFCKTRITDELKLGQVYGSNGLVVHYFCLLTASSLPQNGEDEEGILGFHLKDIQNELKMSATRVCVFCKKKGASVSCCSQKCKKWFHLTCGRNNNSLHQFFGRFKSFCSAHRPKQRFENNVHLSESQNDVLCPICYEHVVVDFLDTLWAPCCKKNAWFHRDCVQKLALSAGYFFKCPLCNNEATFREAMEKFGIYIPQRDALWEQVPNAYQELLYQYRRCDAKDCKCPRGRNHNGQSNWELVRCKTCGSQGIHISCGRLKFSDPEWVCRSCTDVLKSESVARGETAQSRSSSSACNRSNSGVQSSVRQKANIVDSPLSSSSDSNEGSFQNRLRSSGSKPSRISRSNPSPAPSSANSNHPRPEIVPNQGITNVPIKRSKPCPKRFKKDYVDCETQEKSNVNKTETSLVLKADTSVSVLTDRVVDKTFANPAMLVESDSDEDIEVLEVHRVLERKSLTAGDGTKLVVHPVPETKNVVYDIRDVEPCSSGGTPGGPEVFKSPETSENSSASSTSSSSRRSLDPKLFYKPSSSTEKCDRLTEETSGSSQNQHQSLLNEKFDAVLKGSGCRTNPIRSPPKTSSAAAEGKSTPMKPSVTVIPLATNISSHPDRIPVLNFPEPVPPPAQPLPVISGVISMAQANQPKPNQAQLNQAQLNQAQPNQAQLYKAQPSQTVASHLDKPNPPARADFIEEITILDDPSPNHITNFNHSQSFQPQIVNVRSCGNVTSCGTLPSSGGSAMMGPVVPIVQQTGSVLNTNVILCTGLWIPPSGDTFLATAINPERHVTTNPPPPTMMFDAMGSNLNIKISDVRHSNEFFNSPSNSLNPSMNCSTVGEMVRPTLTLPQKVNVIVPPSAGQSNTIRHPVPPNPSPHCRPPPPPYPTGLNPGTHLPLTKPGQVCRLRMVTPQFTPNRTRSSAQDPMTPTTLLHRTYSRRPRQEATPERNSAPDVKSKNDPNAAVSYEVLKENTPGRTQGSRSISERKVPSLERRNRPCPKRFKITNSAVNVPESRLKTVPTSASQLQANIEKGVGNVIQKQTHRICPKCFKPRRGTR